MWHVCRVLWHEGVTCDEYTDTPEDQASLTSMRNEGAARCPQCRFVVSKTAVSDKANPGSAHQKPDRSVLLLAQATVDLSSV